MNPIDKVTGAITHPLRTATSVAGGALHVVAAGVRTATRLVGHPGDGEATRPSTTTTAPATASTDVPSDVRPAEDTTAAEDISAHAEAHAEGYAPTRSGQEETSEDSTARPTPAAKPAVKKSTAKKTPAKKPAAKKPAAKKSATTRTDAAKAPSARAATAGPALASVPDTAGSVEDDTTHLETETEVVYTSETSSGTEPQESLTEPLLDPAVAAALRDEVPGGSEDVD